MASAFLHTRTEAAPQSIVYQNSSLRITLPPLWVPSQAFYRPCAGLKFSANCIGPSQDDGSPAQKTEIPGAVLITKGKYFILIKPNAMRVSGIEGGRFSEIALGNPSVDAVFREGETGFCGDSETHSVDSDKRQIDYFVSPKKLQSWCTSPANGSTVWYFSNISDTKGGYFNEYKRTPKSPTNFVIIMAYDSNDVNALPVKGSSTLTLALSEMTTIVKNLQFNP